MKTKTAAGVALMSLGILLTAGAGYTAYETFEVRRLNEVAFRKADGACKEKFARLGAVRDAGPVFTVTMPSVSDTRQIMAEISILAATCPTRTLSAFCLGSSCAGRQAPAQGQPPGVIAATLSMTRKDISQ